MKNHKHFYELTEKDLVEHPVWSAIHHEDSDDDASGVLEVRPVASPAEVPEDLIYFVAGRVILSDGTEYKAAIEFPVSEGGTIRSFRLVNAPNQPTWFEFGSKYINCETLRALQLCLDRPLDRVFPITLVCEVPEVRFSFHHVVHLLIGSA